MILTWLESLKCFEELWFIYLIVPQSYKSNHRVILEEGSFHQLDEPKYGVNTGTNRFLVLEVQGINSSRNDFSFLFSSSSGSFKCKERIFQKINCILKQQKETNVHKESRNRWILVLWSLSELETNLQWWFELKQREDKDDHHT